MHIASSQLVGRMALAEAGLWATCVNDGQKLVLVVKASTETLKWIHRGVAVELVIGHVRLGDRLVRCAGLRIGDSAHDPLLLAGPHVEAEEVAMFDELLASKNFTVYFHNESPFISVLDAVAQIDAGPAEKYLACRADLRFHTSQSPTHLFHEAQEAFELQVLKVDSSEASSVSLFRLPILLVKMAWNRIGIPECGTFEPANHDEGGSQESLLYQILKPHFQGEVIKGPRIPWKSGSRELCDALAMSGQLAFVFESKAFPAFERSAGQAPERRALTINNHFTQAIGQLQGALKVIMDGVCLLGDDAALGLIHADRFRDIHCIVVVSTDDWALPWFEIGAKLRQLHRPRRFFHFLTLMELQRMVAFALGNPLELHLMLERRAEIICSSGNAKLQTDYIPQPPRECLMPPVPDENRALRFAIEGASITNEIVAEMLNLLMAVLGSRKFSGRCEVLHEVIKHEGRAAYWLGFSLGGSDLGGFSPDKDWWGTFFKEFKAAAKAKSLPTPLRRTARISSASKIRSLFPDTLMTAEFSEGRVIARRIED